jgi:hypothetical protein
MFSELNINGTLHPQFMWVSCLCIPEKNKTSKYFSKTHYYTVFLDSLLKGTKTITAIEVSMPRYLYYIYINKNVNVHLFIALYLRNFFTDWFQILTQPCIPIHACFYMPIIYMSHPWQVKKCLFGKPGHGAQVPIFFNVCSILCILCTVAKMCDVLLPPGVNQMCAVLLPPGVNQMCAVLLLPGDNQICAVLLTLATNCWHFFYI